MPEVLIRRKPFIRIARGTKSRLPAPPNSFEEGRFYFCTDTGELFIGAGLLVPMQPVIAASGDIDFYEFTQSIPAADWVITHNLGVSPAVVVEDSTNTQVFVETHFDDANTVTLHFSGAETGRATLIG